MLFAPLELSPYLRWAYASNGLWQERNKLWRAEMLAKPELLTAYLRYRELMEKGGLPTPKT